MNSHIDSFHMNQVKFRCKVCGQEFRKAYNLKVHLKSQHKIIETPIVVDAKTPQAQPVNYECEICLKVFNSKGNLNRHIEDVHGNRGYNCEFCDKSYQRKEKLLMHTTKHHATQNNC